MNLKEQPSQSNDFIQSSENINKDITDIGLPKTCLNNFLKEILSKNKVRGDKNIIPMLDSISRFYVNYLSSFGSKICIESGKKTLNIEHVIEALKQMNFNKHIDLLVKDLPVGENDPAKLKRLIKFFFNNKKLIKKINNDFSKIIIEDIYHIKCKNKEKKKKKANEFHKPKFKIKRICTILRKYRQRYNRYCLSEILLK